jgi:hypothetical protein
MNGFWNELASAGFVSACPDSVVPGECDEQRRLLIEAELDAYVAKELFGLSRDELAYILDTFPIIEKADRKAHREYRTKRVILEIYDAIGAAARIGQPDQTHPDPPRAARRATGRDIQLGRHRGT